MLTRHGEYKGVPYTLDISPAYLTVAGAAPAVKKKKGFFKTVIAEFVEYALHKLSLSDGFFTEG